MVLWLAYVRAELHGAPEPLVMIDPVALRDLERNKSLHNCKYTIESITAVSRSPNGR